MNGATHVIGGYVFAGTLCAFSDVNIFENHTYIGVCTFFALLPDIDTTRSMLGKIFYPVAWIINRKFGHRTITHSILFLAIVYAVIFSLFKLSIISDPSILKIALYALLSHFIFDMITVSGIPLLYPFYKNPCVIPANPNFRFKSGEWKSELIVMGVCGLLCSTMQPLFSQGFWTTYNRAFGTITHVNRENQNTEYYVICDYNYILNAETYQGEAIVIQSKSNELILFDRRNVFTLNDDNPQLKVVYTKPRISTIEKRFEEIQFFNIPYDSLQSLLSGKLASGLIQSSKNVQYIENSVTYHTNFIKFANQYDFRIFANADSSKITLRTSIAKLEASIMQAQTKHQAELKKWEDYQTAITTIEDSLKSSELSNYERNKLQQELIALRRRNYEKPVYVSPATQIAELQTLKSTLTANPLLFSGYMTVFTFGYDSDSSEADLARKPIYDANHIFAVSNFQIPQSY